MVQRTYEIKILDKFKNPDTKAITSFLESKNITTGKVFYSVKITFADGAISSRGFDTFLEAMAVYCDLQNQARKFGGIVTKWQTT